MTHFHYRKFDPISNGQTKRQTWAGIGVGIAALGVGTNIASAAGAFGGDNSQTELRYLQLPDYPESSSARQTWGQKLQDWGALPGYGAIPQDWGDIWDKVKQKIDQSYWGGVGTTGAAGKVRASAARRGVSESPALETNLTNLGMQYGQDITNSAKDQAIQQAAYSQQGQTNWLNSLMQLAGQKPSFITNVGTVSGNNVGGAVSAGLTGAAGLAGQASQNDWYQKMLNLLGGTGGTPASTSSYDNLFQLSGLGSGMYSNSLGSALPLDNFNLNSLTNSSQLF